MSAAIFILIWAAASTVAAPASVIRFVGDDDDQLITHPHKYPALEQLIKYPGGDEISLNDEVSRQDEITFDDEIHRKDKINLNDEITFDDEINRKDEIKFDDEINRKDDISRPDGINRTRVISPDEQLSVRVKFPIVVGSTDDNIASKDADLRFKYLTGWVLSTPKRRVNRNPSTRRSKISRINFKNPDDFLFG